MRQIHTPEAHAITGGSPEVLVGDIDSGIDYAPRSRAQRRLREQRRLLERRAEPDPAAWLDRQGHGTMTAGLIAAAANGIGIVGVAPNVRIAAIKASSDSIPACCSRRWWSARSCGRRRTTSTSRTAATSPTRGTSTAETTRSSGRSGTRSGGRSVRDAAGRKVVAAATNASDDLAHPRDILSPDFPPGSAEERRIRNDCAVIPVEIRA